MDPHVIKKNWYLKRGLNLYNVFKNNSENISKKSILYTMRYALTCPFVNAIQGFIKQYNYQEEPSMLRQLQTTNIVADVRMLDPDILYLNRRITEKEKSRIGF